MKTFAQAIADRGIKEPPVRSVKYWNSRPISVGERHFPKDKEVFHKALLHPLTVVPREAGDDELVFSSRQLTDWYVATYCNYNRLKP